ncbi:MAG: hypothetical protein ALECFALPRED_002861 [Alectoria fallacina]|uniref:Uncharacterized protein n=1 Tax=Alectoria fallacina TaxID=1903189 RepID=A0A8H3FHW3_9LECA|nr:MAG: hypothetical protein ALECFALPRED_002861 [Alectoria fallacina]
MEPLTPFAGPCANGLSPWHHGGHTDRSFQDDSGYASEDSDFVPFPFPFPSPDPDHNLEHVDQVNDDLPSGRRHRAAAFVNAQWSHPTAFRVCHPVNNSLNDNWRRYDLPQPLAFEQQRNNYESGSRLKPTACSNRESFGREPGHTASRWDLEAHRAYVPETLQSLCNRVESETDGSSLSSSSIRHGSLSSDAKGKAPQPRGSTASAQHGGRTELSMQSSARRPLQRRSSGHDARLAAAWQQLYQDRTELEKERRALTKKGKSLLKRKGRSCSNRGDSSDDSAGEGGSGSHGAFRRAKYDCAR